MILEKVSQNYMFKAKLARGQLGTFFRQIENDDGKYYKNLQNRQYDVGVLF